MRPPPGFAQEDSGNCAFLFRVELRPAVHRLGLDDPLKWQALLKDAPGRGSAVRIRAPDGSGWMLKQMRRGGFAGPLWRERYWGRARPLANLLLSLEVERRGVPTAAPVALLILEEPRGLCRGWLAFEEIEGALDLRTRLADPPPLGEREMRTVLSLVRRMHDAGIEHRDLNLGNLLLRRSDEGEVLPFILDFDRAVLHPRPLGFAARQSALRRLERSYLKWFGETRPLQALGPSFWYTLYAGQDERLARRFERGRAIGRTLLAFHRLGWKRPHGAHIEAGRSRGD